MITILAIKKITGRKIQPSLKLVRLVKNKLEEIGKSGYNCCEKVGGCFGAHEF